MTSIGTIVWGNYYPVQLKAVVYDFVGAQDALKTYLGIKGDLRAGSFEGITAAPAAKLAT